ncbi:hypothetical protein CCACVL1_08871 [Corchorus capsularis]|uniref:Uncharacterized protein n=1 Tax=Corchorus capsularis TaxID=210143 RepID=A0A1R3IYK4_COCAP|nr:hypothetical protein CCACVL1_08871 [Corchorus capsularis]
MADGPSPEWNKLEGLKTQSVEAMYG